MPKQGLPRKQRISFDFSSSSLECLERLKIELGCTSKGEVIRIALGLHKTVLEKKDEGGEFYFKKRFRRKVKVDLGIEKPKPPRRP